VTDFLTPETRIEKTTLELNGDDMSKPKHIVVASYNSYGAAYLDGEKIYESTHLPMRWDALEAILSEVAPLGTEIERVSVDYENIPNSDYEAWPEQLSDVELNR